MGVRFPTYVLGTLQKINKSCHLGGKREYESSAGLPYNSFYAFKIFSIFHYLRKGLFSLFSVRVSKSLRQAPRGAGAPGPVPWPLFLSLRVPRLGPLPSLSCSGPRVLPSHFPVSGSQADAPLPGHCPLRTITRTLP